MRLLQPRHLRPEARLTFRGKGGGGQAWEWCLTSDLALVYLARMLGPASSLPHLLVKGMGLGLQMGVSMGLRCAEVDLNCSEGDLNCSEEELRFSEVDLKRSEVDLRCAEADLPLLRSLQLL